MMNTEEQQNKTGEVASGLFRQASHNSDNPIVIPHENGITNKTGEGNAPRVTASQTEHRLESGRLVYVPPNCRVIRATNLPDSSPIKYWLDQFPYGWSSDNEIESYFRNIGFGFTESEVKPA